MKALCAATTVSLAHIAGQPSSEPLSPRNKRLVGGGAVFLWNSIPVRVQVSIAALADEIAAGLAALQRAHRALQAGRCTVEGTDFAFALEKVDFAVEPKARLVEDDQDRSPPRPKLR